MLGGLAAGFFLVYLLEEGSASVPVLTWSTVLTAAVCAVGGALLASIIPAWRASRQSPLEAAVPSSGFIGKVSRVPVWSVVAGLACVCLQPAALLLPGLEVETRKWIFFWLGYPGLVAGALFLAPTFVRVTEWAGAWITGFLLHVPHSFLKMQLSRNLSRSVGTAVSMSVGLSLLWGCRHGAIPCWFLFPGYVNTRNPGFLPAYGVQICGCSGADGAPQPAEFPNVSHLRG